MLEQRIRDLLVQDKRTCLERIQSITEHNNFKILDPQYLAPTTGKVVKTTSREGSLCYYWRIHNTLGRILLLGEITEEERRGINFDLPPYLHDLAYPKRARLA